MIQKLYIPELNYWFNEYWTNNKEISVSQFNLDTAFDETVINECSFLKLLFSTDFSCESYLYKFEQKNLISLKRSIWERLYTGSSTAIFYICNSTSSENMFQLVTIDLEMLDLLLLYRVGGSVDLPEFADMTTRLSQLIWTYLDLIYNQGYAKLKIIDTFLPHRNELDYFYEIYVINEAHKKIKNWDFLLESDHVKLFEVRISITVSEDDIENGNVSITDNLPYESSTISHFVNSEMSSSNVVIERGETELSVLLSQNIKVGDTIILEYYSKVN